MKSRNFQIWSERLQCVGTVNSVVFTSARLNLKSVAVFIVWNSTSRSGNGLK